MKKRLFITTLAAILIFTFTLAFPASAQQVTALSNGFTNVEFSNGYYGFCIDRDLHGAYASDVFYESDTSLALSNIGNKEDISQYLKILFTQYFEELFVSDGNGGYVIDSVKKDSIIPSVIYHFSDGQYVWGTNPGDRKYYVDNIKAYSGPEIPDEGHTITLDNGDVITFYFMVMEPENTDQQCFFAYKISVNEQPTHTHNFSDKWTSDDDNHWHECDCGEKEDVTPHDGNEPDCVTPSVCDDCGKELTGVDSNNHSNEFDIRNAEPASEFKDGYTGDKHCKDCGVLVEKGTPIPATHQHDFDENTWESDDDNHWHECDCGEKEDVAPHDGNEPDCVTPSVCDECAKELAGVNPDNHISEPEIRDDKPAQEFEEGYSGDKYCPDCDALLEKGTSIPATHQHDFSNEWTSDDDNHWHECDCGEKDSQENHAYKDDKCTICGEVNANNVEIPNTNSNSNVNLWLALSLMSMSGLVLIAYRRRKNGVI